MLYIAKIQEKGELVIKNSIQRFETVWDIFAGEKGFPTINVEKSANTFTGTLVIQL